MRLYELLLIPVVLTLPCTIADKDMKLNVLFIMADDLRPELSSYTGSGSPCWLHPEMVTPNLDELASRSLLLKRAYVQQAVCSPSRTSLLTGRRPDTTHVYDLHSYFRDVGGNYTTIPQYFKQQGYHSVGMGKIFHPHSASDENDPISWSEPYYTPANKDDWRCLNSWTAVTKSERQVLPLPDEQTAHHAISTLRRLAKNSDETPFFMAVGFYKPHLPFTFPEEFLEYYPEDTISLPDNPYAPVNMPDIAWAPFGDLRVFDDIGPLSTGEINTTLPADTVRVLRRAYYSSVSFIDSLVGEVLDELETLGLRENTIVSFMGDHGWQLGEHGEWTKHTNFEVATHTPLMIHVPGLTDEGVTTEQLTEFVDVFPTLVEAAGLPKLPLCPKIDATEVELCREGSSLLPLIQHPNTSFKGRVFSQYPRDGAMGYSMRTDEYRYTEWVEFDSHTWIADWSKLVGVELYDHVTDPEENFNAADDVSYRETRAKLHDWLLAGWRMVLPAE